VFIRLVKIVYISNYNDEQNFENNFPILEHHSNHEWFATLAENKGSCERNYAYQNLKACQKGNKPSLLPNSDYNPRPESNTQSHIYALYLLDKNIQWY